MTKGEKLQTEVITTEQAIYCMNHQYNYEKYECDYCPYCLLCEEKGIEGKMIKMAVKALEENDGLKEYLEKANHTNSQLIQHIEKNNMNIDTSLAIERYQDLVEYFSDKDAVKTILGDREEFKKWLDRIKWNVRKVDELARKLEQEPCEDCVSRANLLKKFEDRFIELQKAHKKDMQLGVNWCINTLKDTSSVTPTHGTCKDCSIKRLDKAESGGSCEPMTKTLGIELRHNPSELVELLEEQYKSGEISPIVISESLITLFRMLEEKRMVESEGQE